VDDNSSKTMILVAVQNEGPRTSESCKPTLLEKVQYALDCLVGDYNTKRAGAFIANVYKGICKVAYEQQTPVQKKIMRMIIPELELHMPEILRSDFYMQYKQTRDSSENSRADDEDNRTYYTRGSK
jgi:hypothetical protein